MKFIAAITLLLCSNIAHSIELPDTVNMELLTPLQTVLSQPKQYIDQSVTVSGEVVAVCKKMGCWAEIVNQDKQVLRLKVRDGETVIPMSARGQTAFATGILTAVDLSKQQAILYLEHMAQDAGDSFDRNSVTEGMTIYNLRPTALKFVAN